MNLPAATRPVRFDVLLRGKTAQPEPLVEARELRCQSEMASEPVAVTMPPGLVDSLLHNLRKSAVKPDVRGGELSVLLSATELRIRNTGRFCLRTNPN